MFYSWIILFTSIGEQDYYERQFATLKSFEEVDGLMVTDSIDEEILDEQAQQERAMRISNYANILLLAFKVLYNLESCLNSDFPIKKN